MRQSTTPVEFNRSTRKDSSVLMTSGRAGVVVPVGYVPLLPGDSASGRIGIDVQLKEMPKPLLNAVTANFQAWFVPKSAMPQFAGRDELMAAMTKKPIKTLGRVDEPPPQYFLRHTTQRDLERIAASEVYKTLGLHIPAGQGVHTDLVDALVLAYNFRLAAHSSKLPRRKYSHESLEQAHTLPPAFWPSARFARVVPDYERALVVGALDLDVVAGRLPISGIGTQFQGKDFVTSGLSVRETGSLAPTTYPAGVIVGEGAAYAGNRLVVRKMAAQAAPAIFAEMKGQSIGITLADIDKARTTQAFARLRTAYAGNDATGFDNDDTIVSLLMQGISVPEDQFKRPWLLDSRRVAVGFAERFATDAANLDASVTLGRASATLSLNVPKQDVGGVIVITCEVLPERIDERMSDEWLHKADFDDLPNALRDVQRVEPVDLVFNRRVDAKHIAPNGLYGFEPMNTEWDRNFTRLGGSFWVGRPGVGFRENRAAIWQSEIANPVYGRNHFLAPYPFPHDVFADQRGPAFELVARHDVSITGLTQMGDVLVENNHEYGATDAAQGEQ